MFVDGARGDDAVRFEEHMQLFMNKPCIQ